MLVTRGENNYRPLQTIPWPRQCLAPPVTSLIHSVSHLCTVVFNNRGRCCRGRPAAELPESSLGGGLSEWACPRFMWVRTFLGASFWLEVHSAASTWSWGCLLAHWHADRNYCKWIFFLLLTVVRGRGIDGQKATLEIEMRNTKADARGWILEVQLAKQEWSRIDLPSELFTVDFRNEHLGVS